MNISDLLGKHLSSKQLASLLNLPTGHMNLVEECRDCDIHTISVPELGLECELEDNKVVGVFLRTESEGKWCATKLELPFGLKRGIDRKAARTLLGPVWREGSSAEVLEHDPLSLPRDPENNEIRSAIRKIVADQETYVSDSWLLGNIHLTVRYRKKDLHVTRISLKPRDLDTRIN